MCIVSDIGTGVAYRHGRLSMLWSVKVKIDVWKEDAPENMCRCYASLSLWKHFHLTLKKILLSRFSTALRVGVHFVFRVWLEDDRNILSLTPEYLALALLPLCSPPSLVSLVLPWSQTLLPSAARPQICRLDETQEIVCRHCK